MSSGDSDDDGHDTRQTSSDKGKETSRYEAWEQSKLEKQIFSWPLKDVLDKNLFRKKVKRIPSTFASLDEYLQCFDLPLIEETRADVASALDGIKHAPATEVTSMRKLSTDQPIYSIIVKTADPNSPLRDQVYAPKAADLLVLTDQKPRHISDLERTGKSYLLGSVLETSGDRDSDSDGDSDSDSDGNGDGDNFTVIRLSGWPDGELPLFAVFLVNLTTYNHILSAINLQTASCKNTNIIEKVLNPEFGLKDNLSSSETPLFSQDGNLAGLQSFELNDSQLEAVHDCVSAVQQGSGSVRLIWGPPGTGKTKTISALLWSMLVKKQRTLTCAPTNTSVVEVASRILGFLENSSGDGGSGNKCFLGDVLLFGNKSRMSVDDNLAKIFLDSRADRLRHCLMYDTGWKRCLSSMLQLLKHPLVQYDRYVEKIDNHILQEIAEMTVNFSMKKKNPAKKGKKFDKKMEEVVQKMLMEKMSLKDYFTKDYKQVEKDLNKCVETFCNDLLSSVMSKENIRCMVEESDLVVQRMLMKKTSFKAYFTSEYEQLEKDFNKCVETFWNDGASVQTGFLGRSILIRWSLQFYNISLSAGYGNMQKNPSGRNLLSGY